MPKIVLPMHVLFDRNEECLHRYTPHRTVRIDEPDGGAQCYQCGGRGRRVDDRAGPVLEYRVVLVLAVDREAVPAALAQAVVLGCAQVPAARALEQIAPQGGDVADLWACRGAGGARECRVVPCHPGIGRDALQGDHGPQSQAAVGGLCDRLQLGDPGQADELVRREQPFLHEVEQIDTAGLENGRVRIGSRCAGHQARSRVERQFRGLRNRPGSRPGEAIHVDPPAGTRPSAVSTAAGVMGRERRRTPVAL